MSGIASAALILSLALVVLPGSPRCRLTPDDTGRRVLLVGARRVAWGVGCVAVGVAALLPLPTVVAVAVLGATLGLRYRRRRRYLRRSREGQALEAALELVVGELLAGAHPVRAFSIAADETGGPVAVALRAVAARARLGADVTAGLLAAARSSALPAYWARRPRRSRPPRPHRPSRCRRLRRLRRCRTARRPRRCHPPCRPLRTRRPPRTRTKSRHRRRLPQSPGPHWRHCPPTDAPTAPEWAHSANRARSAAARRWRPRRPHRRPHLWPRPARTAHGTPPPAH